MRGPFTGLAAAAQCHDAFEVFSGELAAYLSLPDAPPRARRPGWKIRQGRGPSTRNARPPRGRPVTLRCFSKSSGDQHAELGWICRALDVAIPGGRAASFQRSLTVLFAEFDPSAQRASDAGRVLNPATVPGSDLRSFRAPGACLLPRLCANLSAIGVRQDRFPLCGSPFWHFTLHPYSYSRLFFGI